MADISQELRLLERSLQWGHGREAVDGRLRKRSAGARGCFNGATAARPWMAVRFWDNESGLQWGQT